MIRLLGRGGHFADEQKYETNIYFPDHQGHSKSISEKKITILATHQFSQNIIIEW